jgi:hypothetical protein
MASARFMNRTWGLVMAGWVASSLAVLLGASTAAQASFPIATGSAQGQMSYSAAFDGTNYLVGIQGNAADRHIISAQLVSQSGTLVGSLLSTGHSGGSPRVAFDATRYLLAWTDDETTPQNQVYGQFVTPSGTLVGASFRIGRASGGEEVSDLVFGGGKYLVVWVCRGDEVCTGVHGQLVAPSGALVGPLITFSETAHKEAYAAFDGTNYLVVWTEVDDSPEGDSTVVGRFVSGTGSLLGPAFVVNDSSAPSDNPEAIAFDGTNYLVLWNDEVGGYGTHEWDIFGQLVTPAGALTGPVIPITTAPGTQSFPSVVFGGGTYLVTWIDFTIAIHDLTCDPGEGTCADVYGRFLNRSGAPVGAAFPVVVASDNQLGMVTSFGAGQFLTEWNNGFEDDARDVYGAFFTPPAVTTPTLTPTLTRTPTPTITRTPTTPGACVGDCGRDGTVTVSELITMVNIALGTADAGTCTAGDADGDGEIKISELITAVNYALSGCPLAPEQGCLSSGGTVASATCCASTGDFPNTCAIGVCGCPPDASHSVHVCDCGAGKCFSGRTCVGV